MKLFRLFAYWLILLYALILFVLGLKVHDQAKIINTQESRLGTLETRLEQLENDLMTHDDIIGQLIRAGNYDIKINSAYGDTSWIILQLPTIHVN